MWTSATTAAYMLCPSFASLILTLIMETLAYSMFKHFGVRPRKGGAEINYLAYKAAGEKT